MPLLFQFDSIHSFDYIYEIHSVSGVLVENRTSLNLWVLFHEAYIYLTHIHFCAVLRQTMFLL